MRALAQGWNEFWLAWTFLTRLPAPVQLSYSEAGLNRAARYFPWVGAVLGLLNALVFCLALELLGSISVAILLQLVAGLLLTGAFHEDGFADYCDSFGGQDQQSRLAIMVDSRLGTFGVAGLFSILALRVSLLASLPVHSIVLAIIFGSVASRLLAVSLMVDNDYVKAQGKSKPLATTMDWPALMFSALPLVPILLFLAPLAALLSILFLLIFRFAFVRQLRQRLGGYTGDCLGAAQQVAEVLTYAALVAVYIRLV